MTHTTPPLPRGDTDAVRILDDVQILLAEALGPVLPAETFNDLADDLTGLVLAHRT